MSFFEWGWVGFGLYFVILESYALYVNTKLNEPEGKVRRTLSSVIWALGGTKPGTLPNAGVWARRAILGLGLLWLTIHMLSGGQIV